MSIGMTYEQYWYGTNDLCNFYYEAEKLRIEKRNQELWLQGLYNYKAVSSALYNGFKEKGKPTEKYLEKPIEIFPKKQKESDPEVERQKAIEFFEQMRVNMLKNNA